MKYSYRLSKVGGWRGSSFFITDIRPWVISSISSRANKLEIFEELTDSVLYVKSSPQPAHCQSLVLFSRSTCHLFSSFLSASLVKLLVSQKSPRVQLFIEQIEQFNQEQIMFPFVQIAITKTLSCHHFNNVFKCSVTLSVLSHCQSQLWLQRS